MPTNDTPLFMHEEIMLLALREEEGTFVCGPSYHFALGGAILAELLMMGRISVEEGPKKLVNLEARSKLGDPVIDECLDKVKQARRRANLQTWVNRFANLKQLKHRVAHGLCKRRILRADQDKILLLFTRRIYPERDAQPERKIIARLRKAIFTDSNTVDSRTAVLVSLANASDLLKIPFDKKELRSRKKRIETISNGDLMGKATKEAIQAAQAAATMAAVMPALMVTTVTS